MVYSMQCVTIIFVEFRHDIIQLMRTIQFKTQDKYLNQGLYFILVPLLITVYYFVLNVSISKIELML